MNFERLSKKISPIYLISSKKKKKFFEFYIDEIKFYDLVIFQDINIKIINVPFQDNTITYSNLIPEKSLDYYDFFLFLMVFILTYFFIIEFITIWYKENIINSDIEFFDRDNIKNFMHSILFSNFYFFKNLSNINNLFNSNIIDFLSIYGYIY